MSYLFPRKAPGCAACPLCEKGILVHDEIPEDGAFSGLALIGEMPGREEVQKHHVFVGMSGKFLRMMQEKLERGGTFITNAIRCGLPGGMKPTNSDMLLAAQCCKPSIVHNLKWLEADAVLAFGATAMYHYMGVGTWDKKDGCKGIDTFRGTCLGPTEDEPWSVTCTLHPAGIIRTSARYVLAEVFRDDFEKAYKLGSGELKLYEPDVRDAGDVEALIGFLERIREFASSHRLPVAIDVETDGTDALLCDMRTIGFSFKGVGYSIPYPTFSPDFYTDAEWDSIIARIFAILEDPTIGTIYHNKQFDVVVLERILSVEIKGDRHDTLLMHHAIYPQTKHDLQSVASQYMAVEPWKTAFRQIDWAQEFDEQEFAELLWYNAQDCICTEYIYHQMRTEAQRVGVTQVIDHDREKGDMSIDLYRTGIKIDTDFVDKYEVEYRTELEALLTEMQEMVADATGEPEILGLESFYGVTQPEMKRLHGFNPRSPKQLRKFLFTVLGLTPAKLTKKLMDPATSMDALWEMRNQSPYFEKHFLYKKKAQVHSLYLKDVRTKNTTDGRPYLHNDGRVHPSWKGQGTVSGRYAGTPNVLNFSYAMLEMFIPREGCVMIGADYATLEVRVVAALAGQMDLVETFNSGEDVHEIHASELFYSTVWAAAVEAGDTELLDLLRTNGKPVTFGKNYLAGWETIYEQIREDRPDDDPFELRREVKIMCEAYDQRYKAIVRMAATYHEFANSHHHLKSAILGRLRKWPLGKAKATDCANFPVQGTAADIMDLGMLRYRDSLRKAGRYLNGVWPILQIHDSFFSEVREELAEEERARLEECLSCEETITNPITGNKVWVRLPAEAKIGPNVRAVK